MKKVIWVIILNLLMQTNMHGQNDTLSLAGTFQGKNLYFQTLSTDESSLGCGLKGVTVNGIKPPPDGMGAIPWEIDLYNCCSLKIGDSVEVRIIYDPNCSKIKILNEYVLAKSTFIIISMNVDSNDVLQWKTKNEEEPLSYTVEQFRWDKWVKIGDVEGKGTTEENEYSFKFTPHTDTNLIRVYQLDYRGNPRFSKPVMYEANIPEVFFTPKKVKKEILFSSETMYEIYDSFGNIVKKGISNRVDCRNLKSQSYSINYDNKQEKFYKK